MDAVQYNLSTIFSSTDTTLEFQFFLEGDERDLTGQTLTFKMGNRGEVLFTKNLSITSPAQGEAELTISDTDLVSLRSGRYDYTIRITNPTQELLVYGDVSYEVRL